MKAPCNGFSIVVLGDKEKTRNGGPLRVYVFAWWCRLYDSRRGDDCVGHPVPLIASGFIGPGYRADPLFTANPQCAGEALGIYHRLREPGATSLSEFHQLPRATVNARCVFGLTREGGNPVKAGGVLPRVWWGVKVAGLQPFFDGGAELGEIVVPSGLRADELVGDVEEALPS